MGLDMTYTAGEQKLSFRLTDSDIDVLEFLRSHGLEREVEDIFGVCGFGEESSVDMGPLLSSVERLLEAATASPSALPYVYGAREEIPPGSGQYSIGSGTICGIRIGGQLYSLTTGLDHCELTTRRQDASGNWYDCEPEDVRARKVIKVDKNDLFGDIIITKRRKPTKLTRHLEQLHSFLRKTAADEIHKMLG